MFFLCYYYNGDGMDIKIEDIQETNKVFNWKKLLIIILSILLFFVLVIIYSRYKATSGLKVYEYKITDSSLPEVPETKMWKPEKSNLHIPKKTFLGGFEPPTFRLGARTDCAIFT